MCDLSVVKEFPHLMKQLDLKLPRLYSTMSTQLVYKSKLASTSDPTINIRRGYVMGLSIVSIWSQKDKKLRRKWLQYDEIVVNINIVSRMKIELVSNKHKHCEKGYTWGAPTVFFTRTRVNVRNVCLQLPNIMLLFASCFQMTSAKWGHQLNCSYHCHQ
jgi:hypothetical protein